MKCDAVSPFLISKTRNNGPFKSRHFFFPVPFCSRDYTLSCSSFNNLFLDKHNSPFEWRFQSLLLSRSHLLFICGLDFSLDWNFIHQLRGLISHWCVISSSSNQAKLRHFSWTGFLSTYLKDWTRKWCAHPCHRHAASWYFFERNSATFFLFFANNGAPRLRTVTTFFLNPLYNGTPRLHQYLVLHTF